MPPSPIPAPLPPWAKAALWLAPYAIGYLENLLTHQGTAPAVSEWRRLAIGWDATPSAFLPRDRAWCTLDIANITGGSLDSSWTTGDYTTCETAISTWLTNAWRPYGNVSTKVTELKWYKRAFNDYDLEKPFRIMGPPDRVTPVSILGSGSSIMPTQVALTVTKKTPFPGHWGRLYLPFLAPGAMTGYCRIPTASIDAIATATQTLVTTLQASEFYIVIPVTQVSKVPTRGLVNMSQVQVDDLFDVMRSRRLSATQYRKVLP